MVGQQWYHHPARFGASGDAANFQWLIKKRGTPKSSQLVWANDDTWYTKSTQSVFCPVTPMFLDHKYYISSTTHIFAGDSLHYSQKNLVFFPFKDITPLEGT